MFVSVGFQLS